MTIKILLTTIAVGILALGFFVLSARTEPRTDAPVMMQLREQLLRSSPAELGITPRGKKPYVAVMDIAYPNAVVSVVTASSGDASIYFSTGGGIIGGIGHEDVRRAAIAFVKATGRERTLLTPTTESGHPPVGQVRFFTRAVDGLRSATVAENQLRSGTHALSPLYLKGQDVIAQLRLVTGANRR
jgi:hypothetical protein